MLEDEESKKIVRRSIAVDLSTMEKCVAIRKRMLGTGIHSLPERVKPLISNGRWGIAQGDVVRIALTCLEDVLDGCVSYLSPVPHPDPNPDPAPIVATAPIVEDDPEDEDEEEEPEG